ncbi:glycosyltransferase [Microbacterium sp. SYP-A9085]|uniref:glycosyltransferase n=1 Tax=Microbacterium sp. SYP-A9085 TaxID=2664454 RepID=UPI00129B841F|nr:nucleotide disphospho-sugar-binding domain-containing protein [Microbacterium sp. SYP-A9085]MRH27950.1 glycosyltransferase [Microbacterium sp. SYP-A9085]
MKILAYTSPSRGHLFPLLPILIALRDRGHEVAVRTLAAGVDTARACRFTAAAIDPRIEAIEQDDYRAKTALGSVKRSTAVFVVRAGIEVPDLRAAIAAEAPDILIVDINCWGAAAAAEKSGLPWATFLPYPAPFPGAGIPPFGPGLRPARGIAGRLRDRLLGPIVIGGVERSMTPPLNTVRGGVGVPPTRTVRDIFTRAPLTLYLTAEPFEYHRTDWPASYRLVGPVSFDPPAAAPAWLDDIHTPIVLVTTSSEFQDDGSLIQAALDGLRDEDVFVIATQPAGDPTAFEIPANARVERWVSHAAVLPRAVCVVTHGGMGATQKALAAGVPVVAVPFGRDQHEVARRVEVSDAGVQLPSSRLSPARIREAVRDARTKGEAARRLAGELAAAGGAARAAAEVEALPRAVQRA